MSQGNMNISNESGASYRADVNTMLQALASTNSGASAPSTPYAQQLWVDTDTPSSTVWTLNIYDGTDWIPLGYIDSTNNVLLPFIGGGTTTIASASTTDLGSKQQSKIQVTGTTTITSFGTSMAPGQVKVVDFAGILTLTHNATSLILPGGANITTAAGDMAIVTCISSGNYRVFYQKANGTAVAAAGTSLLQTINASGSPSVVFNSTYVTNAFNKYVIEFDGLYNSSNTQDLWLLVSTDNGSTYASSYVWSFYGANDSGGALTAGSSSDSKLNITGTQTPLFSSATTGLLSGTIKFSNAAAAVQAGFRWEWVRTNTGLSGSGGGSATTTTAINNVKIQSASGNLTGNFHLQAIQGT